MVHITTAAMWQKLNISKQSQRIVLRYLSNIFGTKLVVPKYCIDGFRQDHVIPQYDFLFMIVKMYILWTKPISKIFTISLESLHCK